MIVVLKPQTSEEKRDHLIAWLKTQGVDIHLSVGTDYTIIGLVGNTAGIDVELLESLEMVMAVRRVGEPFKQCNRMFHPEDTVIEVGGVKLGGAFKPRTSPYAFQGLRFEGLKLLSEAKRVTGLPIVSEIMNVNHLPLFEDVDIIQVGARNMQNFDLLQELGRIHKPVLLKRGLANTLKELLMSAEYIMAGGNEQVILCERGIRTFETYTRNTLDLSAVPKLHELSHLPVVVDPSHATGEAKLVPSMALAAAACGADGLMIEVHNDPAHAKCDGAQSLTPAQFDDLARRVRAVREALA